MNNLIGWSDQTWLYIDQLGILVGLGVGLVSVVSLTLAVFGFFNRERLRRWLLGNRFPRVGGTDVTAADWDGLIFTVSRAGVPCWVIDQCQPRVVGLIHTADSREDSDTIANHARQQGCTVVPVSIDDPDNPSEARQAAAYLIDRLRHDRGLGNGEGGETAVDGGEPVAGRLAVDVTGGKVPMSLGAFMAAEEAGVPSLYVSVSYNKGFKGMDLSTARIVRVSQPGSE